MPSIVIKEIDETTGGGRVGSTDIVYVPGFRASASVTDAWPKKADNSVDMSNAAPIKEPILCETVAEFKKYFGTEPVRSTRPIYYGDLTNEDVSGPDPESPALMGQTPIYVDLSYIYAIELINNGIPVLYEAVNELSELTGFDLIEFYHYISNSVEGPFGRLKERGEFDVKYLTTGGYANTDLSGIESVRGFAITKIYPSSVEVTAKDNIEEFMSKFSGGIKGKFECLGVDGEHPETGNQWKLSVVPAMSITNDEATEWANTYFTIRGAGSLSDYFEFEIYELDVLNIPDIMADCASARGDAIAFLDPINDRYQPLTDTGSYYKYITAKVTNWMDKATYATTFVPSVNIDTTQLKANNTYLLPGSYAYLAALGQSIKNNPSWLAIAGAARGSIPNLNGANPFDLQKRLTNTIAENEYQNRDDISINAITNIKPFGQRIWGNRTLKNNALEGNLTATSFLNLRNLVCDVKKIVYQACRKYTFEQNNDILWTNFKAYIEPTLERMRTGAGISGYKIIKGTTTEKAKLVATVRLYPIYAVEDFEITVVMSDDEVSVS